MNGLGGIYLLCGDAQDVVAIIQRKILVAFTCQLIDDRRKRFYFLRRCYGCGKNENFHIT
jgi:hypothetical protein